MSISPTPASFDMTISVDSQSSSNPDPSSVSRLKYVKIAGTNTYADTHVKSFRECPDRLIIVIPHFYERLVV